MTRRRKRLQQKKVYFFQLEKVPMHTLFSMLDFSMQVQLRRMSKSIFQVFDPLFSSHVKWLECPQKTSSRNYVQRARLNMQDFESVFLPQLKMLECILPPFSRLSALPKEELAQYTTLPFKVINQKLAQCITLHFKMINQKFSQYKNLTSLHFIPMVAKYFQWDYILPPNLIFLRVDDCVLFTKNTMSHWPHTLKEMTISQDFFSAIKDDWPSTVEILHLREGTSRTYTIFPDSITTLHIEFCLGSRVKWPTNLTDLSLPYCRPDFPISLKKLEFKSIWSQDVDVQLSRLTNLQSLCIKTYRSITCKLIGLSSLHTLHLPNTSTLEMCSFSNLQLQLKWPETLTDLQLCNLDSSFYVYLPSSLRIFDVNTFYSSRTNLQKFPKNLTSLTVREWLNNKEEDDLLYFPHLTHLQLANNFTTRQLLLPFSLKDVFVGRQKVNLTTLNYLGGKKNYLQAGSLCFSLLFPDDICNMWFDYA